ncbi:MAG: glutathione-disulfide reductase [Alphaproteobacteria bacterium]|nr:glutathione-disulfide reductase [Alphaproteobacteria bacterium]
MTEYDYDLFTIGAGSGGVRATRMSAQFGARVAVAEEDRPGGTCVLRGCVPKKLLVYASAYPEEMADAPAYGWSAGEMTLDWPRLRDAVQAETERLSRIYRRNLGLAGAEIFDDRAILKDPHTVHLVKADRDVTARHILVAVGAWPFLPQGVPGIEHAISSNEIFHLETLPERAVIVGGGYIAVEFAGILNGLGVDVTLLYRGAEILRGFDLDLRALLVREMAAKGIKIQIETNVKAIEKTGRGLTVVLERNNEIETDLVLYATGRRPKTEGLGCEAAGVRLDRAGAIIVDAYSKSSVDSIHAIGDVTNRKNLTPVAIREGICLAETLFNNRPMAMDYADVPTAVFSQPPLGTVGLTEAEARAAGHDVDIYKTRFRTMKHSFAGRDEHMFFKLVVDARTDRVLGCHILGHEAGEMIQIAGIAVKMGATKAQFDATCAVHPTAAEELVTIREKYVPMEIEVERPPMPANPARSND